MRHLCDDRQRTPHANHAEHQQRTEYLPFGTPLPVVAIADQPLVLQLFHTIDEHIGLGYVFQIAAPVTGQRSGSGVKGIGLQRNGFLPGSAGIGIVGMRFPQQHIVEMHVLLSVFKQLIDSCALADSRIAIFQYGRHRVVLPTLSQLGG